MGDLRLRVMICPIRNSYMKPMLTLEFSNRPSPLYMLSRSTELSSVIDWEMFFPQFYRTSAACLRTVSKMIDLLLAFCARVQDFGEDTGMVSHTQSSPKISL